MIRLLPLFGLLSFIGLFAATRVDGSYQTSGDGSIPRRLSNDPYSHRDLIEASLAPGTAPMPSPMNHSPADSAARVYHVTDYGGDPTGVADSTAAIQRAISDAVRSPSDGGLMPGIPNLGGAELHLDGGLYSISSPLSLPSNGAGNLKIHSGSLKASDQFPPNRYLIELWSNPESASGTRNQIHLTSTSSGYDYEYVTIKDLALDSNFRCGGIAIVNSLRTTVENIYAVHFTSDGIWVKSGHETYIRNSYIGQHVTAGGDPGERNFTGVGINLMGNDNAVTDVVIFSAAVGIMVSGQANTISGVHCYNKATGFGGVGIYLKLPGLTQTRIVNCYFDYTGIVSEDPNQLHVSSSFFLGGAYVAFKSMKGMIKAVQIVDNMFSGGGNDIVQLDDTFFQIDQVYVVVLGGALGQVVAGRRGVGAISAQFGEGNNCIPHFWRDKTVCTPLLGLQPHWRTPLGIRLQDLRLGAKGGAGARWATGVLSPGLKTKITQQIDFGSSEPKLFVQVGGREPKRKSALQVAFWPLDPGGLICTVGCMAAVQLLHRCRAVCRCCSPSDRGTWMQGGGVAQSGPPRDNTLRGAGDHKMRGDRMGNI